MSCEGLTLIFHRPSGVTHVVAPPVAALLDALAAGPADAAALALRLGFADAEAGALVAERLAELVETGLAHAA